MKPKPFASLNHFTVPVITKIPLVWLNCDGLQFIPESERGSNCRRNLGGTTELTERSALQPGHYTGVGVNSYNYLESRP